MQALLALLPCAVVIGAVLALGWSGLAAAAAALMATLVLVAGGMWLLPSPQMLSETVADAALVTLIVAATTVPGVVFIEATRRLGSPEAVAKLVGALRLPGPQAAVLVAAGIGVLVESLTGNGVSLLLTVPQLVTMLPRSAAIGVALVGMSVMPWGALAIAGTVGAALASIDTTVFGLAIWRLSGFVAALLPLIATWLAGGRMLKDYLIAGLCGAMMWAATRAATVFIGMELAGVAGGLAVLATLGLRAERSPAVFDALRAAALRPYAILIAAVTVQVLLVPVLVQSGFAPRLATGRVSWAVLTSPGVALLMATLLAAWRTLGGNLVRAVLKRSWRAVASVALFLLTARLLVASGAIDALTTAVEGFGALGTLVAVTGLGATGGFVTGSGVTGNALFLPAAAQVGEALGARVLYSALASAASGHAAMTSLPVAALLLAALPERRAEDDRTALRSGLSLAALTCACW